MYIPAITIVEECNNAETGVGADIADTNHVLKGNCALLTNGNNIKAKLNDHRREGQSAI